MKVIMTLNRFANRCGYFFNCNLTQGFEDKPNVNNGYNCNHPDCGDEEDGIGCCRADTCPLAFPADGLVCQSCGVQCSECGNEDCDCDDDMVVAEVADHDFDPRYMTQVVEEEYL